MRIRVHGLAQRTLIKKYLREHAVRKLHLGCGRNPLAGWLNSDRSPKSRQVVRIDVTTRFPFADDVFSHVFSSHMIEHLAHPQGAQMLIECHRILQPGGRFRVSTPDLSFLLALHGEGRSDLQREYIEWATRTHVKEAPYCDAAFVINNFVRDWGHQFIYDEPTLRAALAGAGFARITRCELNESEDVEMRGLDNETRLPAGFLDLESLTLEGVKE